VPDTQLQLRGGTKAENDVFTGAAREVTVDTSSNSLRAHDGATAGGMPIGAAPASAKTGDYTALLTDRGRHLIFNKASAVTFNLTAAATLGDGWFCYVSNIGAGALTVDPNSSETIDAAATIELAQATGKMIVCDGTKFETIGGGGGSAGLTHIATITAAAASSVDFDGSLDGTYDRYVVIGTDVHPATDNVELWIRTDSSGGASYDSGASDYSWSTAGKNAGGGSVSGTSSNTADAQINATGTASESNMGNVAAEVGMITVEINNPAGTTYNKWITWLFGWQGISGGPQLAVVAGGACRLNTAAIDSIQFLMSSGNISGVFRLYGINNG